ncbi:MAG: efflux RND transporter permease subunit, partial [Proteobacteria bacterium]|nr:efflux RND transporter permease subunit [Pseudomonadota bacterium]
ELRVRAAKREYQQIDEFLDNLFFLPNGQAVPLRELFHAEIKRAKSEIRHYNLRRTIQVEAELDKTKLNTVDANKMIQQQWQDKLQAVYPEVNLDFSGELDDIQESLDAMLILFMMGLGIMYMILGAQFRSYFQPLMILLTVVPLAFIGVIIGLIVSQNPLSLYTLYGVVALTGIAVNAAIVLMAAARDRLNAGMSINHATIYAARRRLIPILITSLTTMASLFSLATGLAGESLMWGPVATAIVWGLGFSTLLTLYIIPLLFRLFVRVR